ncbi:MAG TPA: hypothetical protein RMG48_06205 [Myxococcales bacterium LLY-WYZ-16_1]|jgi:hypothetical protein|nr:hypothetical protein [Myxococcales bacterium LLY-WYZ-16_1]
MPRSQFGPFSLDLPGGYGLSNVFVNAPDPSGTGATGSAFAPNVVVSTESVPENTTPRAVWDAQRQLLQQAGVPSSAFDEPREVTLQDGTGALLGEQVVTSPAQDRIRQLQLCVVRDGISHLVVASHLDGAPFDRRRDEFTRVLLSFA